MIDATKEAVRRDEMVVAAERLAEELCRLQEGRLRNLYERLIAAALVDQGTDWMRRLQELVAALRGHASITRSKNLDKALPRIAQCLKGLLDDRRWTPGEKQQILGWTRWALRIREEGLADLPPLAPVPPPAPSAAEVQAAAARDLAAMGPADRLRKLLPEEVRNDANRQAQFLENMPQRQPPLEGWLGTLEELKAAVAVVFEKTIAEIRDVVAGRGPAQAKLDLRKQEQGRHNAGTPARREADKAMEKAETELAKERKRAERCTKFLGWLDAS